MSNITAPSTTILTCVQCANDWVDDDSDDGNLIAEYTGPMQEHCYGCRFKHVSQLYTKATSWTMIIALNYWFVCGKLWGTFTHAGALHKESARLVPGLKRLHEFGLLPTSSQPFEHEVCTRDGQVHEYMQRRPYLTFVIPTMH
jgi:hypothetical protein